jgi:hypothetical protein
MQQYHTSFLKIKHDPEKKGDDGYFKPVIVND